MIYKRSNQSSFLLDRILHLLQELFADRILLEANPDHCELHLPCVFAAEQDLLDLDVPFVVVDDPHLSDLLQELAAEGDAFVGHPHVEELVFGVLELLDGDRHAVHRLLLAFSELARLLFEEVFGLDVVVLSGGKIRVGFVFGLKWSIVVLLSSLAFLFGLDYSVLVALGVEKVGLEIAKETTCFLSCLAAKKLAGTVSEQTIPCILSEKIGSRRVLGE